MTLDQVVGAMPFKKKAEILNDYNILTNNGNIGECALRSLAEKYKAGTLLDMTMVANVVAHSLANEYINLMSLSEGALRNATEAFKSITNSLGINVVILDKDVKITELVQIAHADQTRALGGDKRNPAFYKRSCEPWTQEEYNGAGW